MNWRKLPLKLEFSWFFAAILICGFIKPSLGAFDKHPKDVAVIEGQETQLDCRVDKDGTPAEWYVYTPSQSTKRRITNGFQNRFFLMMNGDTTILYINETFILDEGIYFCESGVSVSQNASLKVLPKRWPPHCTYDRDAPLDVGSRLDIICISRGDPETALRWMRNNDVITETSRHINGSSVILHANVIISEQAEVFICEASLPELRATEICILRPTKETERPPAVQYVAYSVVILLCVVVVVLFIVMIYVILRQRQCRYFHRSPPPPQTVLDMDQLQSGLGPVGLSGLQSSDRDTDSIGSAFDLIGPGSGAPPPDVVPTGHRRGNVTQRSSSPTSTLRHNMNSTNEQEKPGIRTPKIQSPRHDRRNMQGLQSEQNIGDVSFDPNIPSTSNGITHSRDLPPTSNHRNIPSSSNGESSNLDSPSTSTAATRDLNPTTSPNGTTLKKNKDRMNDLGTLKKERLYKKSKMSDQRKKSVENNEVVTGNDVVNNLDSISLNIKEDV